MDEAINCKQYTGIIPDDLWKKVEPLLAEAAEYSHGEYTPESIRLEILQHRQQIWVVSQEEEVLFVWVTIIHQGKTGKRYVTIYSAAGVLDRGWDFWPYMSQWMIGNGLEEAEIYCRPSLARLLRRKGYTTRYEVLVIKPIGDE